MNTKRNSGLSLLLLSLFMLSGCFDGTGCPSANCISTKNSSNYDISELYIAPSSYGSWGPNQLGGSYIQPGQILTIYGIPNDCYDLQAIDIYSNVWTEYNVCLVDGQSRTWTLYNGYGNIASVESTGKAVAGNGGSNKPAEQDRVNSSEQGTSTLGQEFIDRGIAPASIKPYTH